MHTATAAPRRPKNPPGFRNRCGVPRRMRALGWMGQGPKEIAALTGEDEKTVERWFRGLPVRAYVVDVADYIFERLSMTFGPNEEIAAKARRLGWAPPLAWLHLDIDHPDATPHIDVPRTISKKAYPLESQIYQAILGIIPAADLLRAERVRVVSKLHQAGWSDRRIAAWMRWNTEDLDKGQDGVCKYRQREGITGLGLAVTLWDGSRADIDFTVTPAAA